MKLKFTMVVQMRKVIRNSSYLRRFEALSAKESLQLVKLKKKSFIFIQLIYLMLLELENDEDDSDMLFLTS